MAISTGFFGVRLVLAGLKALIAYQKTNYFPINAKQIIIRDITLGILLVVLAIALML